MGSNIAIFTPPAQLQAKVCEILREIPPAATVAMAMDAINLENHTTLAQAANVAANPTNAIADAVDATNAQYLALWFAIQIFYSYYLGPLVNYFLSRIGFDALGSLFGTWISWYYSPLGWLTRAFVLPFLNQTGLADDTLKAPAAWICLVASLLWAGRRVVENRRDP
ncbi:hypothetical protein EYR41_006749 [Orbilia oligospora]|uniref:Uncharacterized protein n=1 Tax=Orbilia oligospora TaxID=2813651 RepID=A0A7C8TX97_ORBOL|nr:hypothetical protein TWF751_000209 [Orbilia oligospora]TGJ67633.1 hypothetical protein EYR41_006749 [Orbilia oligospora]